MIEVCIYVQNQKGRIPANVHQDRENTRYNQERSRQEIYQELQTLCLEKLK